MFPIQVAPISLKRNGACIVTLYAAAPREGSRRMIIRRADGSVVYDTGPCFDGPNAVDAMMRLITAADDDEE